MGTVCEGGCDLTRRRGDAEKSAEFNAADGVRGGMGWETRKNAPKNVGGPEGTPPERLRYGAATKNQRVRMGFRREDIWGVGNSYKEACVLGAAGYGSKGGCGIFNTNQNFLNRFLLGNGDFDVNVWNRGVYTSK